MAKFKIVILGPESTGKTTLAEQLAMHYNTKWLPEYAREYIENLGRSYTYEDVLHISQKQIELEDEYLKNTDNLLFVDTDLIITKIWFKVVYKKLPEWIDCEIKRLKADFYLLCYYDIRWYPDNVRENSGRMRKRLFRMYENELININADYQIINGVGKKRFQNAYKSVEEYLSRSNYRNR